MVVNGSEDFGGQNIKEIEVSTRIEQARFSSDSVVAHSNLNDDARTS